MWYELVRTRLVERRLNIWTTYQYCSARRSLGLTGSGGVRPAARYKVRVAAVKLFASVIDTVFDFIANFGSID